MNPPERVLSGRRSAIHPASVSSCFYLPPKLLATFLAGVMMQAVMDFHEHLGHAPFTTVSIFGVD
jgi:hypothetical protein